MEIEPFAPALYIPVGPPASGKSVMAAEGIDRGVITGRMIVSPDLIREWLTNDRADQTANRDVFVIVERIAMARIQRRLSVYLDATNLSDPNGMLQGLIGTALLRGLNVYCIVMETSRENCLMWNEHRHHRVPDSVMERMFERMAAWELPAGAVRLTPGEFLNLNDRS